MAIHLPGEVQYLNGAAPNASLYQSGSGQVYGAYAKQLGDTHLCASENPHHRRRAVGDDGIFPTTGNSWAGRPDWAQLMDTNNVVYSASYDQSTTQLGEASSFSRCR